MSATAARECAVKGCDRPTLAKGFCKAHYYRMKRGVDLRKPIQDGSAVLTTATRIPGEVNDLMHTIANKRGISTYTLLQEIILDWAEAQRPRPPTTKAASKK